jgi:hypothetical protein
VFPVRYKLDSYILIRRNSVFKGLINILLCTVKSYDSNHQSVKIARKSENLLFKSANV